MIAVLFGYPMREPRDVKTDGANKILWLSRFAQTAELMVHAHLVGSTENVDLGTIPLGPSIIDMPHAGCWRLTLRWSGHIDTVDILYAQG